MTTHDDFNDVERDLRDATHAYADQFEPAPDSWAQLRARADAAGAKRGRPWWAFGVGGIAIAAAAAATIAIVTSGGSPETIEVDNPTVTQPATDVTQAPAPTTPSSTPSVAPEATLPPLSGPQTTPSVVVANGVYVLGGWNGTAWTPYDMNTMPISGGKPFDVVVVGAEPTTRIGQSPMEACEIAAPATIHLEIPGVQWDSRTPTPVAITGVANVQPWDVELLRGDTYREAAVELIESRGGSGEVRLVQVVRTDLEGDGVDEIVIVAETGSTEFGTVTEGETSIAFLRRVVDGEVRTFVLDEHIVEPQEYDSPYRVKYKIDAVADLNGDGVMEIVVGWYYYEGNGAEAFEVLGSADPVNVLGAGCGA